MSTLWFSVLLGAVVGVVYGAIAYVSHRLALGMQGTSFLAFALGGMLARMVLVLVLVGLTLAFVNVDPIGFAVTLAVVLLGVLAGEALLLKRRLADQARS